MSTLRIVLAALGFLPLVSAAAQTADSVPIRLHTIMSTLDQGSIVRLRLRSGIWAGGPLLRTDSARLEVGPYLGYADVPQTVPLAGLDSMWTRGSATAPMAGRGAILGAVLSFGIAGATTTCEGKYCTSDLAAAGVGGAVGGALLGALVGSATPRWKLRYGRARSEAPAWAIATNDTTAVSWQLWHAVAALPFEATVRLRMTGGPDIEGQFEQATASGLAVRPLDWLRADPVPVAPAAGIRGLYQRGDARKESAVLGGILGLSVAMWLAVDDTCPLDSQRGPTARCTSRFVSSSVLGGAAGAVLGRWVGMRLHRWHRRFP